MALTHFTRPALPYDNAPLPNDKRFQTITQTLRKPITDGLLDAEFNSVTDNLNILDVKIESVVAGNIPGSDNPDNENKLVTTDGASTLSFVYVTNDNVQDDSLSGTKITTGTIGTDQLDDGIITPVKVPNASLPYSKMNFNDGDIPYSKVNVSNNTIPGSKIVNGSVDTIKIADNSIITAKIVNGSVTLATLAADVTALFNSIKAMIPPIGSTIFHMGSNAPPANFILADGRLLSRATYPALFTAYGTTYSPGDGATTFGIPDLRGLNIVGIGPDGSTNGRVTNATAPNIALGQTFGEERHTLTVDEIPSHTHSYTRTNVGGPSQAQAGGNYYIDITQSAINTSSIGGGQPHNNMQPGMFGIFYVRAL